METMCAPWRMEYLMCEKQEGCVFCKNSLRCEDYVLFEGRTCFVMLNRYPYVNGHLMIIPMRHLGDIVELTPGEREEIFSLVDISVKVLKEATNPQGFNIGMNLGKAAGAGIAEHVHVHVIPRWEGDTNFMSVVGNVRVIPQDLATTAATLIPLFEKYCREV
ncbi:MAG: HIT domain-containing protein [Smithellaceae bacterium]|nr:HIT domain-containing protein [Smithellaceae bacterium]